MPAYDEAFTDESAKPTADEALVDQAPIESVDEPEPEDFDLAEWLQGIGPARFAYTLDGRKIEMRSRTLDWAKAVADEHPDDEDASNRAYVAGHIIDERITADTLEAVQANRPNDFAEMLTLCIQIDTRPTSQIQPRFLLAASD